MPDIIRDLTQDTFLRVINKIDQFQGNSLFSTWLTRIAINNARMWLRTYSRDLRRYYTPDKNSKEAVQPYERLAASAESEVAPNPLAALVEEYDRSFIQKALRMLSENDQQLLYLRYVEDCSHAEIAERIGKNEGAVRVSVFRALDKLKEAVEILTKQQEKKAAQRFASNTQRYAA